MPDYTAEQRAARGFAVLDQSDRAQRWREAITGRLSFTEPGWDILAQIHGSTVEGMAKLAMTPADAIAHGFIALNGDDAERLRKHWLILLTPEDDT